jgi:hypothetical protein
MDRGSFVRAAWVKALSGTAFTPAEDVVVFAVVPAVVPPFCGEAPVTLETGMIAEPGGVRIHQSAWTV